MRYLVLLAALLLPGCWAGEGLYSNGASRQAIPAGLYRATNNDGETHIEQVTRLANGLTRIGDSEGKGLYGFAPLDREKRRWVVWYREDNDSGNERAQLYMLLERRSNDEFALYLPNCEGENAELAQRAG